MSSPEGKSEEREKPKVEPEEIDLVDEKDISGQQQPTKRNIFEISDFSELDQLID